MKNIINTKICISATAFTILIALLSSPVPSRANTLEKKLYDSVLVKSLKWENVIITQGESAFNEYLVGEAQKNMNKSIIFTVKLPSGDLIKYNRYPGLVSVTLTGQRLNSDQPKIGSKSEPITVYYQDIKLGGVINRTAVCKKTACVDITPGLINIPGVAYKNKPIDRILGHSIFEYTPFVDLIVTDTQLLKMNQVDGSKQGEIAGYSILGSKKTAKGIAYCAGYVSDKDYFAGNNLPIYFCFNDRSWQESSKYQPTFRILDRQPTRIGNIKAYVQPSAKELVSFGKDYFVKSKVTTYEFAKYLSTPWVISSK